MTIKYILESNKNYIINEYRLGKSTNKIAKEFDCNSGNIYILLQEWGEPIRSLGRGKLKNKDYQIRKLHSEGLSCRQIAKQIGCTKKSILIYLDKIGLKSNFESSQREDPLVNHKQEIIDSYNNGKSTSEIAKDYNASQSSIFRLIEEDVVFRPKNIYNVNTKFFDIIDSEAKAHVLGLMYTDGCNKGDRVYISMTDKDCVYNIAAVMEYDGPIYEKQPRGISKKVQYELAIGRVELAIALDKLGCGRAKSHSITFPNNNIVPQEFKKAFLLGAFEGDGGISDKSISFCGNLEFLTGINNYVRDSIGIEFKLYPCRSVYNMLIGKKKYLLQFLDWLYDKQQPYLSRKYNKYLEIKTGVLKDARSY